MPTQSDLKARKRYDLIHAVDKFGGIPAVARALGYSYRGRQRWTSIEDLRGHLDPIVAELGCMPSVADLTTRKRMDLTGAITKFGGYPNVAKVLGYPYGCPRAAPKLPSIEELRKHLDSIVAELGRMPTQRELKVRKRSDIVHAMAELGGLSVVAQTLGYPYQVKHRWQSVEDLRPHLSPIVRELGRMPSTAELEARKRADLLNAVGKFGGIRVVADQLGYPYSGRRSWKGIDDLRPHLDPVVAELGHMPSVDELKDRGRPDLQGPITKFGGFPQVAAALGYPYAGLQSWASIEDLRAHLDPIVAELGRMPTQGELLARRRSDVNSAIEKFGGYPAVAIALDYPHKGRQSWKTLDDVRRYLDPIVAELGRMPTQTELTARRQTALTHAIGKFGGVSAVAEKLGYPYSGFQSWSSLEDLRPPLDPIVAELGRMPTQRELRKRDRADLMQAVAKFGGFAAVAEALGYTYSGYKSWSSVEDLREHLDPIVADLGRMPTVGELTIQKRTDLTGAIGKFGGFPRVAEALGYPYLVGQELERRIRRQSLEEAILQLHGSQLLSAGQVMILLRHAGLLSRGHAMQIMQRLQSAVHGSRSELDLQLSAIAAFDDSGDGLIDGDACAGSEWDVESLLDPDAADSGSSPNRVDRAKNAIDGAFRMSNTGSALEDVSRDREAEVRELCGWSAVGNLIDPTPALVRLSVTRLKTAFYRFASERRRSLEAPAHAAGEVEVEQLKRDLWESAFGEYEDLIENELVQAACEVYISDLSNCW